MLIKGISETIRNKAKKQKGGFLGMLLGTLDASLLGNMSVGKPKIHGRGVIRAGEGLIWAGEGAITINHPLTNFEIQSIIKMNLNLMVFIQDTIYLK